MNLLFTSYLYVVIMRWLTSFQNFVPDKNSPFYIYIYIYIYIYAFSRRFYPKRLTIAFRLYIFIRLFWVVSDGLSSMLIFFICLFYVLFIDFVLQN